MNTPAHVVFSLALLGRGNAWRYAIVIAIGALLPDAVIFVFYAWHKIIGTPESIIWSQSYYQPEWQDAIDLVNSIPLIILAIALFWWRNNKLLVLLFASMLVHSLWDFPVHHDDAHRHFFPFSNWRFESPLSYWDRAYYGRVISGLELILFFAGVIWLWKYQPGTVPRQSPMNQLRWVLVVTTLVYGVFFWFVFHMWV